MQRLEADKVADAALRDRLKRVRMAMGLTPEGLAARIPNFDVLTITAGEKYFGGTILRTYECLVLGALNLSHPLGIEAARAVVNEAPAPAAEADPEADDPNWNLRSELRHTRARLHLDVDDFARLIGVPAAVVESMELTAVGTPLRAYCMAVAGGLHAAGMDVAKVMPAGAYKVALGGEPPGPQTAVPQRTAAPRAEAASTSAPRRPWRVRLAGLLIKLAAWVHGPVNLTTQKGNRQ